MNEIQLIEIEQRAEKATPGPWKVEASTEGDWVLDNRDDVIAGTFVQEGDADFIAHAREDVPALVAEVRRLRRALHHISNEILWPHYFDPKIIRAMEYIAEVLRK